MNIVTVTILFSTVVFCAPTPNKPLDHNQIESTTKNVQEHRLAKRFINPSINLGYFSRDNFLKIRAKRDLEEECEKLRLCKLHARSSRNFIAAFELYFVNKENARLWDHRVRSPAECDQRYHCYE